MNKVTFTLPPPLPVLFLLPASPPPPLLPPSIPSFISPSIHSLFLELWDAEGQRSHEVVAAGQVPVPHLHWQAAVLVVLLQVAGRETRTINSWMKAGGDTCGVVLIFWPFPVRFLTFKATWQKSWINNYGLWPCMIPLVIRSTSFCKHKKYSSSYLTCVLHSGQMFEAVY